MSFTPIIIPEGSPVTTSAIIAPEAQPSFRADGSIHWDVSLSARIAYRPADQFGYSHIHVMSFDGLDQTYIYKGEMSMRDLFARVALLEGEVKTFEALCGNF